MSTLTLDLSLFRPEAVDPETRAINAEIERVLAEAPPPWERGAEAIRESRKAGEGLLRYQPFDPKAAWMTASANGLEVPVRVFTPEGTARGVFLHIHGGGHTLGSAEAQDQTLRGLSDRLGIVVVSVDYRLAPESPYPAGPDDCEAAALWLVREGPALFGTNRFAIGGESAGAHLCACTLVRLKERHGLTPFSGADLVYGAFDLTGTPSALGWGPRNLVINTPIIEWFYGNFLPGRTAGERRDPDISPLYADLTGLCPARFSLGTLDPLMDDTLLMAQRWGAAGNATSLDIYAGGIHAFTLMGAAYPMGQKANADGERFLADVFGTD